MIRTTSCYLCQHFICVEGVGYTDTHNGLFIVYCLNGNIRPVDSLEEGCPHCDQIIFSPCLKGEYVQ